MSPRGVVERTPLLISIYRKDFTKGIKRGLNVKGDRQREGQMDESNPMLNQKILKLKIKDLQTVLINMSYAGNRRLLHI